MYSLLPVLFPPKAPTFPPHISRSVKLRPHLIRRQPPSSPQAIFNASLSSPPVASALRADTGSSSSEDPLQWEELIEKGIYRCRFLAFFGVLGSLMGSVLCYLKGCVHVINSFVDYIGNGGRAIVLLVEAMDTYLIGTVMLVFGMGLFEIFISNFDVAKNSSLGSSFIGLFKLPEFDGFISVEELGQRGFNNRHKSRRKQRDLMRFDKDVYVLRSRAERPKWLEIKSVSELKTKVGHAVVLVLLIGLFDKSRKVTICSTNDLLYFAASILFSSGCLYLLSMLQS